MVSIQQNDCRICPLCGDWIYDTTDVHICSDKLSTSSKSSTILIQSEGAVIRRIADALERIADRLEEIRWLIE